MLRILKYLGRESMKDISVKKLKAELLKVANQEKAKILSKFFKTGKGEYADGDKFLGITVPVQRKIARKYLNLSLSDIKKLLSSEYHEHRFTGMIILCSLYQKSKHDEKKRIYDFYLKNLKHVNNWDLVDISAPAIIGDYLLDKERSILYKLASSESLWVRRIAILSTFAFIKKNQFHDTLHIAGILIKDKNDLIHKAVGWMLREVGKRDKETEEQFLKEHYQKMPRTMLRYAIEKFNENERKEYLNKK
jgi:3-methyladenine DNA glycosylase AlkD